MHCPRCGQQQASEEIKFCSRCGFPLGLVSELISHGGFLPQLADLPGKKKKRLTRKNGLKFSLVWFIFFTMLLTALAGAAGEEDTAAVFAIIGSLGGLLLMTSSFLFLPKGTPRFLTENALQQPNQPGQFAHGTHHQAALPPQTHQPAESYFPPAGSWKAPNTGDLVQPGSVTDATTKLLKKDE
jgi:hypothetical protein